MQGGLRAIVADKEDICREILTETLRLRGYHVLSFSHLSATQLSVCVQNQCTRKAPCADFILVNNQMSPLTGLDLFESQLHGSCGVRPEAKALFSTNWSPDELVRAKKLGCKAFLKPYDYDALADWLDEQERKIVPGRVLAEVDAVLQSVGGK